MNIAAYIKSMRLRTLPLSIAGSGLGLMLAMPDYKINYLSALLILLTSISLQILSNLSNELGDVQNGTDTEERQGLKYGLNSGEISIKEMKILIRIFVIISMILGIATIHSSFGSIFSIEGFGLLILGISAIISSMKYTLGKNPYGYRGLGDIFVFTYFGIASVVGSYFVVTHEISNYYIILPAVAMGALSVSVLNLNNIRDMKTDAATRLTVAILLGEKWARLYQLFLISTAFIAMLGYAYVRFYDPAHYLFLLSLPIFIYTLYALWKKKDKELDPILAILSIGSFIFALLSGIGYCLFLI